MRVRVTQADIDIAGLGKGGNQCPVAQALHRHYRSCLFHVERTMVVFYQYSKDGDIYRSHEVGLPLEAREFIWLYDMGSPILPFSFELDTIEKERKK